MATTSESAWWIALVFMVTATLLTIHQIRLHLNWNTNPRLRRYIIRIISMVPIYAFTSWLGLTYPQVALYFDFLRECYEAFVIYCFFQLLVQALGGEEKLAYRLAGKDPQLHQIPFCCLPTWPMVEWDTMTAEEKTQVKAVIERERKATAQHQQKAEAAQDTEKKLVDTTGVHEEGPIETIDEEDGEVTLQHPPNASHSAIPVHTSHSPTPSESSSTSSAVSAFFRSSQPPTPKQPSMYMAHGLAHQTVSHPFTPHPLSASGSPSSSFSSLPSTVASSPSGTNSPSRLPYLYSPFLFYTQVGTLQYCILKPILALISFILGLTHNYGSGEFSANVGYPYVAFVTNASQIWALYSLVMFYLPLKEDLAPIRSHHTPTPHLHTTTPPHHPTTLR